MTVKVGKYKKVFSIWFNPQKTKQMILFSLFEDEAKLKMLFGNFPTFTAEWTNLSNSFIKCYAKRLSEKF